MHLSNVSTFALMEAVFSLVNVLFVDLRLGMDVGLMTLVKDRGEDE